MDQKPESIVRFLVLEMQPLFSNESELVGMDDSKIKRRKVLTSLCHKYEKLRQ